MRPVQELVRPYFSGWLVQKHSDWLEELNAHILLSLQVAGNISSKNMFNNNLLCSVFLKQQK